MWVKRGHYEFLRKRVEKLTKENNELKPLPKYDVSFMEGNTPIRRQIAGDMLLSYDAKFINFLDRRSRVLAVIPSAGLISILETKN